MAYLTMRDQKLNQFARKIDLQDLDAYLYKVSKTPYGERDEVLIGKYVDKGVKIMDEIGTYAIRMRLVNMLKLPSVRLKKELKLIKTLSPIQRKELIKQTKLEHELHESRRQVLREALALELHESQCESLAKALKKLKKKQKKATK